MLHTGMMWYAQIYYRYVSLDWMCLWNDERVKSKQKNIQKMLQEKWEKRTPSKRYTQSSWYNSITNNNKGIHFKGNIVCWKQSGEKIPLAKNAWEKIRDILMKLLMFFFSRILFTFFFLLSFISCCCNVCVSLAFRNYIHFFHFFHSGFSSSPINIMYPCW